MVGVLEECVDGKPSVEASSVLISALGDSP